ncbi:hypothetical protein TWF192_000342 [Orbilia oligospora]|nr:hypothetical protein TWF192_000342 [Orbilia oligospora]
MAISAYRRSESNRQFYIVEDKEENELPVDQRRGAKRVFRTSGNTVIVCAITSVIAYIILIYLVLRLNVDPKASRKPSKQIQNLSGAIALGST